MADRWMIRGPEFANCNCNWGCPCQFGAPTTYGHCEAVLFGHIDKGNFNDTSLDGLNWALLVYWPGEIAAGNGKEQAIIDVRADAAQREALRKILHGESTAPGATHFFVYSSTMSAVLDTIYAPLEVSIDVEARTASLLVPDMITSVGSPIISSFSGEPTRSRINLPDGFEYITAEMGNGNTSAQGEIALELKDSYGQFCELNMTQDGVIR